MGIINKITKKLDCWYHNYRHMRKEKSKREKMLMYLTKSEVSQEAKELVPFFERHCFEMLPYFWTEETSYFDIEVKYDADKKLYFCDWHGRKLYWCEGDRPHKIRKHLHALLLEQDSRSPHKYVVDEGINGAVLADVGAAEGCFTLDVIDRIKHAYIFECDARWIKALEATFEPWNDKVTIVRKYVGGHNDDTTVTLDEYFKDKNLDYIKADIEGAEIDMLRGGDDVLENKVHELNICTYHRPSDFEEIEQILTSYNFKCYPTNGFICLWGEGGPEDWLRKGVILAKK
ncbi:MAG: FkbM family methyltransferase [Schwartzia succinivorans]|uniref:FkbM family methyltransferase n=1 Tax=Schwartzia succinivorans TaxID=55507 RepID=UPI00235255DD|nr:FkbM family methyltransferase [Schwartzia succinivorans]MBE6097663.1 FkbM family methyltransferase [Schwartzia succinivorans]